MWRAGREGGKEGGREGYDSAIHIRHQMIRALEKSGRRRGEVGKGRREGEGGKEEGPATSLPCLFV